MWQEIISYAIVAVVVILMVRRQVVRFRRPPEERCDSTACADCALKEKCKIKTKQ